MSKDEQADLFRGGAQRVRAYPNGPGHRGVPTSVAAAKSIGGQVAPMHTRILGFLAAQRRNGATYREIMVGCKMESATVCGRMVELVEAKTVRITRRKRPTPSGRQARVYVHATFWNPATDAEFPQ